MNTPHRFQQVDAFEIELPIAFEDSRRLTGINRFVAGPAAVLGALGPSAADDAALRRWQEIAARLSNDLGWSETTPMWRRHATGVHLVVPCPPDRMFTATEINEYAWEEASGGAVLASNGFVRLHAFANVAGARTYFQALDVAEREPGIAALRAGARARRLPVLADDDVLSIGAGSGARTWSLRALPAADTVPWAQLHDIPTVLVTGSNGKTTTTRVIAAMLDAWRDDLRGQVGISCTEGIQIGGAWVRHGDYSGPAGARQVLRDPRVAAAVLETARGGILRRGLAVEYADVAVVTNVAEDHFGEYGVDSLDDLAGVKLSIAGALDPSGTLVVNADDATLMAGVVSFSGKLALFALDDASPVVQAARARGAVTCAVRGGVLWLTDPVAGRSLGNVDAMPLSVGGAATYNVANLAAAALAAHALGMPDGVIGRVLASFGRDRGDNPGRLERWKFGGITVLIDYAHNPDGLSRLLAVGQTLVEPGGHLLLLLGQAGNRDDGAIADLARAAAGAQPGMVVIKELPTMLRGRQPGEVPALLEGALRSARFPAGRIVHEADEIAAVRRLLGAASRGDVVVLPVHQSPARVAAAALLDDMEDAGWQPGMQVPAG